MKLRHQRSEGVVFDGRTERNAGVHREVPNGTAEAEPVDEVYGHCLVDRVDGHDFIVHLGIVHVEVVAIDPINQTVTINLINGFSFGRPVWYLSMDTSIPLGAAIEHNTFAPLMSQLHLGTDDRFSSPIERIFIGTNAPESGGGNNPLRQGLSADLADGHRPNNVLRGIPPIALDYSTAWDAHL